MITKKILQYLYISYIQEAIVIEDLVRPQQTTLVQGVMMTSDHAEGTLALIKHLLKRPCNITKAGAFFNYSHGISSCSGAIHHCKMHCLISNIENEFLNSDSSSVLPTPLLFDLCMCAVGNVILQMCVYIISVYTSVVIR